MAALSRALGANTHALKPWFEKGIKTTCQGYARLIRYAACFVLAADASHFMEEMKDILDMFHLQLALEKTKLFEFG